MGRGLESSETEKCCSQVTGDAQMKRERTGQGKGMAILEKGRRSEQAHSPRQESRLLNVLGTAAFGSRFCSHIAPRFRFQPSAPLPAVCLWSCLGLNPMDEVNSRCSPTLISRSFAAGPILARSRWLHRVLANHAPQLPRYAGHLDVVRLPRRMVVQPRVVKGKAAISISTSGQSRNRVLAPVRAPSKLEPRLSRDQHWQYPMAVSNALSLLSMAVDVLFAVGEKINP